MTAPGDLRVTGAVRDLDGAPVRRVLPSAERRAVGPYVFFDHFGPLTFAPGQGLDVRPHPHMHLATVTYLFEGAIMHRDSLGSAQVIEPGAVNLMTAGRGIVHSERSPADLRATGGAMHGLQMWLGLPEQHEDTAPAFDHYPAATIPAVTMDGARGRVAVGHAYGVGSPVRTLSPTLLVELAVDAGAVVALPDDYEDRALYVADGRVQCAGHALAAGDMLVLDHGAARELCAEGDARVAVLGGAPLSRRYLWWNLVSSSRDKLAEGRAEWAGWPASASRPGARFRPIPGDDAEYTPGPAV